MTTNNLIGYDPLAWMDGEVIDETPEEPVKKITKSRAKPKTVPVEIVEEPAEVVEIVEDTAVVIDVIEEETSEELSTQIESENDVEIDISIDEKGEIEIIVEKNIDVLMEIAVEPTNENDDDVLDSLVEEANEISEESVPEIDIMQEETVAPLIELGTEASLKTIAVLYEKCKSVLAAHEVIEINASDVTTIDTATFQLLVSLKKEATLLNKTINIIYPSARFIESARLLDLLTALDVSE